MKKVEISDATYAGTVRYVQPTAPKAKAYKQDDAERGAKETRKV